MNHIEDQLPAYILGDLSEGEIAEIDAHLESCDSCRAELRQLRAAMVQAVESLPAVDPPIGAWEAIAERLAAAPTAPLRPTPSGSPSAPPLRDRPPRWRSYALAASVALLLLGGLWNIVLQRELRDLRTERAEAQIVNRWLAREDLRVGYLEPTSDPVGSVLFLADGRALLVLTDAPPERRSYQAWGLREGEAISLGLGGGRTLEVDSRGFDTIGLSLEPAGGNEQPTDVLGFAQVP